MAQSRDRFLSLGGSALTPSRPRKEQLHSAANMKRRTFRYILASERLSIGSDSSRLPSCTPTNYGRSMFVRAGALVRARLLDCSAVQGPIDAVHPGPLGRGEALVEAIYM